MMVTRRTTLALAMTLIAGDALAEPKTGKPWLGVSMQGGPAGGVLVDLVFKKSPAAQAKLQVGDMLVSVDGVHLDEPKDLVAHIKRRRPGMTISLKVRRGGRESVVPVELGRHPGGHRIARLMHVGNPAPDFGHASAVQGKIDAMSDMRGEVVVVEFFASWCHNCRALTPKLGDWHKKLRRRKVRVVGLTSDNDKLARDTIKSWKIPYPVASDPTQRVNTAYRVSAIPAVFLIDKKGVIRDVMIGYDPSAFGAFERHINKLLAQR